MSYLFEQFSATRSFSSPQYSPDGQHIAYIANTTGDHNLWVQATGGGFAKQLTSYSDKAIRSFKWSPDGAQIAFIADEHGNEMHQIFVLDAKGGWPQQITDNAQAQHQLADWLPDGSGLIFSANDREPSEVDTQLLTFGKEVQRLAMGGVYYPADVSPDASKLVIMEFISNTHQNLHLYDFAKDELTQVTPNEDECVHFPAAWRPDGSGFYLLSNRNREYQGVGFYDLAAASWDWVYTPDADVDSVNVSKNGELLIFNVNEEGASKLRGQKLETGDAFELPDLPLGVVGAMDISSDAKKAVLLFGTPRASDNIYELELTKASMNPIEQSMLGGVPEGEMLEPTLIAYESFDGRQIPAWLYKPKTEADSFPVMLYIHGGPSSQERPNYAGTYQYLLSRGIGVLAPNIRGSTGYGSEYQKLIHGDWGGDELKDIEHAAKYLRGLDWVNADKLGVFGGSFGGFATLSALTRLPEYWTVGVDMVGPSNLITFVESVPPHWRKMTKAWVGDAQEDAESLKERSPITHIDNIRAPLLVIQGANDPRVVKAESDQMVEQMRAKGLEVEYYVDDKSGHGPTNREERNKWIKMSAEFLEKHLLS